MSARRLLVVVMLVAVVLIFTPNGVVGETIIVDDDGGGGVDYTTIGDAIANATDFDEIKIRPGTYEENVYIGKPLYINGSGSTNTIIDGQGSDTTIEVSAWVSIRDLGVKGGGDETKSTAGIDISHVSGVIIQDCAIYGNAELGMFVMLAESTSIIGCRFYNNTVTDIEIQGSTQSSQVVDCTFEGNSNAAITLAEDEITVKNCDFEYNGIEIWRSLNETIIDCTFDSAGIRILGDEIDHWVTHNIGNTTVNGNPFYYHRNEANVLMDDPNAHYLIGNCTEITAFGWNSNSGGFPVQIGFSDNFSIASCEISEARVGIYLYNSLDINIQDSIMRDNGEYAIYADDATNITIDGCTFRRNSYDSWYSEAVYMDADNSMILNSSFVDNHLVGMEINTGSFNLIENNTFCGNGKEALRLAYYSSNNVVVDNVFMDSGISPQAYAHRYNDWDDGFEGNYWSDYLGNDTDGDGVGDTPYEIEGASKDNFPLMVPNGSRTPNELPVGIIVMIDPSSGGFGQNITFLGNGTDADGTVVRYVWTSDLDGEFYNSTSNGTEYSEFSVGEHQISFTVQDDDGDWSEPDSAMITINHESNQTNDTNDPPVASITSITPSPAYETFNVTFEGNGTDNGTVERYVWSSSVDGEFYDGLDNTTMTDTLSIGNHTISFRCQDDDGAWSEWVTEELEVKSVPSGGNIPPVINSITFDPNPAVYGQTITFTASATDVDGMVENYFWTSTLLGDELYDGPNPSFTKSDIRVGTHTITLVVTDDDGNFSEAFTAMLEIDAEAEPPGEEDPDEEEQKGIADQIIEFFTGLPQNPLMLGLVLTTIFVVIGAIAAASSRKKKRKEEEERKKAEQEGRMRGPPPDERMYRPPPGWKPGDPDPRRPPEEEYRDRRSPHDRLPGHAPPPEDADVEWNTEPVGGPPRGDHAEHFYDREQFGRPRERMDPKEGEWEARGYERGGGPTGPPPASPYERPRPEHEQFARPPPETEFEPEPEPEPAEEEDDDLYYDRGGKGYKGLVTPVEIPEDEVDRKCPECNASLDEDERFCSNCGTYLT